MYMRAALAAVLALQCLAFGAAVSAQPPPSAESMVDQLRPRNTRSLRNLVIEPRQDSQGNTGPAVRPAPPSLSLSIEFDFDSARVRPESRKILENLAQAMQSAELATSRFAVEGHTDARGGAEYNQRLSQRRADAVRDVLALLGVEPTRLSPLGKGAAEPVNPRDPKAGENRRVLIVNLD
jgi:outer membrane protein OmpA-like peptidoglycan-associated protein